MGFPLWYIWFIKQNRLFVSISWYRCFDWLYLDISITQKDSLFRFVLAEKRFEDEQYIKKIREPEGERGYTLYSESDGMHKLL